MSDANRIDKKRSIGKVAKELGVQTHVIRFWESKFPQIRPEIGAGNRRYYFDKNVEVLSKIKSFLYEEGYTISGLQKLLKKRKKNDSKDDDLDLISSTPLDVGVDKKDFAIDDFIDDDHKLTQIDKSQINNLVKNIENNLDNFQKLLSKI